MTDSINAQRGGGTGRLERIALTRRQKHKTQDGLFPTQRSLAPGAVVDFALRDGERLRRTFDQPLRAFVARTLGEVGPVVDAAWNAAREGAWVVGMLAYEAAGAFDPALRTHPSGAFPLAWFGVFEAPIVSAPDAVTHAGHFALGPWSPELDEQEHAAALARVRAAIAAGETYQLNFTFRMRAPFSGDPLATWEALQQRQAGAFGAFLDLGEVQLASASPELFFHWDLDRLVTRPMKGTRARQEDPRADAAVAHALLADPKDRAENAMIVDLLRNDLGRLAIPGTVRVPERFQLERYPTVWQLTSTVEAQPRPGCTLREVLTALFPCGSITGAPKVQTMALTHALERSARGAYCGALGVLEPGGAATFNVAIRTLTLDPAAGVAHYGTGGGITWDSEPRAEWAEALAKTRVLQVAPAEVRLLCTLRLEDGHLELRDAHLERLSASALALGYGEVRPALEAALDACVRTHATGRHRIRLTLSPPGTSRTPVALEVGPLPVTPPAPRVTLAPHPLPPPACFHKTTDRRALDAVLASAPPGTFDVLLVREGGALAEFTRGNLVLEREDGSRWTPPLEVGLLPGSRRAHLLSTGRVREKALTLADLQGARLWFVNGLRGEVEVRMDPSASR